MTVNHDEMLSALVDGQLSGKELDEAISLVTTNERARALFLRYQHASDFMHGYTRASNIEALAFSQNLSARIADEPAYQKPPIGAVKATLLRFPALLNKQVAGLAMAASVGALAVAGVMNMQTDPTGMTNIAEQSSPVSSNRWTVAEPEVEDRLNTYLVDHNEFAGASGVFSYGRVVSYGSE